mmetsp:Transcript_19755/g.63792  ORF Transcript_19755/g.63792 Transcript_19755/m.63792 type:complete len:268 (-) Transcript_19755:1992-2795(-)
MKTAASADTRVMLKQSWHGNGSTPPRCPRRLDSPTDNCSVWNCSNQLESSGKYSSISVPSGVLDHTRSPEPSSSSKTSAQPSTCVSKRLGSSSGSGCKQGGELASHCTSCACAGWSSLRSTFNLYFRWLSAGASRGSLRSASFRAAGGGFALGFALACGGGCQATQESTGISGKPCTLRVPAACVCCGRCAAFLTASFFLKTPRSMSGKSGPSLCPSKSFSASTGARQASAVAASTSGSRSAPKRRSAQGVTGGFIQDSVPSYFGGL